MKPIHASDYNNEKIQQYEDYEKQGLGYNFGQYDWELLFVYDYETRKRIIAFPHISHNVKHLYTIFKSYLIEYKDFCFPDKKTLAMMMGCGISSISKYLNELEEFDLIKILRLKHGSQLKNVYIINKIDKIQTIKRILFYKNNQPRDLKPAIIFPDINIEFIINAIEEKTGNRYIFLCDKKEMKHITRDKEGRFQSKSDAEEILDNVNNSVDNLQNNVDKCLN